MGEEGDLGEDKDLETSVNADEKTENGATKIFKIYVENSYAGLGNMSRAMNTISGGTMGEYVNMLQGMILQHQQRDRNESGGTLVVWFMNRHPHNNREQVKVELNTRVQMTTGKLVDPTTFQVGWTTINLEGTRDETYVILILAKSELHATL